MGTNPELTQLTWYGIDFDGTLVYDKENLDEATPVPENIELVRDLHKRGKKIIIYTARHWDQHPLIKRWLKENNVPFKMIVCGKLLAESYIDDRAINPFCGECVSKLKEKLYYEQDGKELRKNVGIKEQQ